MLQVYPWPSLLNPAFFDFWWCFPSPRLYSCLPVSPSSSFHTFFYIPASFLPWLPLFLPPSAVFTSTLQREPQNCLYPNAAPAAVTPAQLNDPCSYQQLCPRVCIALPKLFDRQPTSCISFSKISPVHSLFWQRCVHGSSGV